MKAHLILPVVTMLVAGAMFGAVPGRAQTVTVIDNSSPEPKIIHVVNFSTTLSATVSGLPTVQGECQLTSETPTWSWTAPGSGFTLAGDTTSSTVTLKKDAVLTAGSQSVSVTATATWTDTCGGSYTKPGTVNVTFFVIAPTKVVKDGAKTHTVGGGGHSDAYPLKVIDNQATPAAYGNGLVHETFANIKDGAGKAIDPGTFNPGGPDTWTLTVGGDGFCTGAGTTGSTLTDTWSTSSADTFDQPWFCWELKPGATLYFAAATFKYHVNNPQNGDLKATTLSTALNTHHGDETALTSLRSYPGQAGY